MNFAFTTVLLLVFLLPGAIFRRFYFTEQFSKQYSKSSFLELALSGFMGSIVLHSLWIYFASLLSTPVNFQVIGMLLMSKDFPSFAFVNIDKYLSNITIYFSSLLILSAVFGYFSHRIIRRFGLDRKFKLLRFQNYWHYIMFGEFHDFPRAAITLQHHTTEDIELVFVDVLIETKDESLVYQGILVDYELTKEGGLDCIYLKGVKRTPLSRLKNKFISTQIEQETFAIPGQVMILPYSTIKNLNFSYYTIETIDDREFSVKRVQ
jgi:hypothetical protein